MNLYLVSRTDQVGYDEYDAFVVAARDPIDAKLFLAQKYKPDDGYSSWSHKTEVELIGVNNQYTKPTEILGSFNAG